MLLDTLILSIPCLPIDHLWVNLDNDEIATPFNDGNMIPGELVRFGSFVLFDPNTLFFLFASLFQTQILRSGIKKMKPPIGGTVANTAVQHSVAMAVDAFATCLAFLLDGYRGVIT